LAAVVLSTHDPEDPPVRRINELTAAMLKSGILVQLQTRFYVSTAHTDEEIDHAVQVFGEALTARAQVGHAQ
jgi:glutamate-1-semialdehyde aminotransferase